MPRTHLFRSLVTMAVLLAADLADGESVFTEGVLVVGLVVANCYVAGWLLANLARSAPVIDRVMMPWVVPCVGTFELVRKSRSRMEAVAVERSEEQRRQGQLT